ncbi:MAG: tetraacyldisaccharide 4'-kinase [Proteobacteria bacterium]|nr:tetraacyldisaccharide 4'-kinase [Pseudomonadota bacterium]
MSMGGGSRIEDLMHDRLPARQSPVLAAFLSVVSQGYSLAMRARWRFYRSGLLASTRLPCAVVSVGNLSVGGTGKTPVTLLAASALSEMGYRVAVISRGYGGSLMRAGGVVSDGREILLSAAQAGDEPWLLARRLPGVAVAVGARRVRSGALCVERFGAQVLILDDGFQHLALARDLDIVLMNSKTPLGNGQVFPRGPLREPVDHLLRAHALVLTRAGEGAPQPPDIWPSDRPVFSCSHLPTGWVSAPGPEGRLTPAAGPGYELDFLAGRRVAAFSGIANNESFFSTLRDLGHEPVDCLGFADHHPYAPADLAHIRARARERGADCLVTTEKDLARLGGQAAEGLPLYALAVEAAFPDAEGFRLLLSDSVERALSRWGKAGGS